MMSIMEKGFIRLIVIIVIAIFILSYLGIDLKKEVESAQAQKNIGYVKALVITVWEKYLEKPATYLWNIFINLIWEPSVKSLEKLRDGQSPDLNSQGPKLVPSE